MPSGPGRILTTHTGSLPRPRDLVALLREREEGRSPAEAPFPTRVRGAVAEMVRKQAEIGLSVVNDGEQGRADYTVYVKDRLTGFDGESAPLPNADAEEFPEWTEMARQFAPPFQRRPACTGPVTWKDWAAVERDIQNLKDATVGGTAAGVFMTSPSPGQIGRFLANRVCRLPGQADSADRAVRRRRQRGFRRAPDRRVHAAGARPADRG